MVCKRLTPLVITRNDNAPISEALLFADLIVIPSCGVELRENVFPTGICFVEVGHRY
jgi:hypothetical protein